MKNVDELMKAAVEDGVFPGGSLLVAVDHSVVFNESYGETDSLSGIPVAPDTVFDLASLTKPLATVPAVMQLITENKLSLETKVSEIFPSYTGDGKQRITIANLLCHNSGLPDYRPYYKELRQLKWDERSAALKNMVFNEPLINVPGEKVVYSDLGFMILCWLVEELSNMKFERFIHEKIYKPLGIQELFFNQREQNLHDRRQYAATEDCPWRKTVISGSVHDDNAWVIGGVCGHAGLFGTIQGVYSLLVEYLAMFNAEHNQTSFDTAVMKEFLSEYKKTGRTLGFDMPSKQNSSSGEYFSELTVGHLGFTGTSFWMDLQQEIIIILLSNRVHPSRDNIKIQKLRPEVHNCIMRILLRKKNTAGS